MSKPSRKRLRDSAERLTQLHFRASRHGLKLLKAIETRGPELSRIHEAILRDAIEVTNLRSVLESHAPADPEFSEAIALGEVASDIYSTYLGALGSLREARNG